MLSKAAVFVMSMCMTVLSVVGFPSSVEAGRATTSKFVPADAPCRVVDTRDDAKMVADEWLLISLRDQCGIPADAVAGMFSVTVVDPEAAGHVTLNPGTMSYVRSSTVNFRRGETRANHAIVQLSTSLQWARAVSTVDTHLIVDVQGWFVNAAASSDGRFVAMSPQRLLDTRATGKYPAGTVVQFDPDGLPADAVAVAVNVTTAETTGRDHVTVWPADRPAPTASVLNVDGPGQVRAAFTVAGLNGGRFNVRSHTGQHLIVDVVGYFTGPSASYSTAGLFQPVSRPYRMYDSRVDDGVVSAGSSRAIGSWVPDSGAVLVGNLTAVAGPAGHWTAHPAFYQRSAAKVSSVNIAQPGEAVANMTFVRQSEDGAAVFSHSGGHVIFDLAGYFVGEPLPSAQRDTSAPRVIVPRVGVDLPIAVPSSESGAVVQRFIDSCAGATMVFGDFDAARMWIGAHRTACGAAGFGGVETLSNGDKAYVELGGERVGYTVVHKSVVDRVYPNIELEADLVLQTSFSWSKVWVVYLMRDGCPGTPAAFSC